MQPERALATAAHAYHQPLLINIHKLRSHGHVGASRRVINVD
jgi:hypothetical protein